MPIKAWSTTASSNATADTASGIIWSEGQAPSSINDSARAVMAELAEYFKDNDGTLTTGGTSTAYTLTNNGSFTSLADGLVVAYTAHTTCGANPTLNVNGLGAKKKRKFTASGEVDLEAGDEVANGHYNAQYDSAANGGSGAWIVLNPVTNANSYRLRQITKFTASGTWTKPSWCRAVRVTCVGAGGGGGYATGASGAVGAGGGGGGGAAAVLFATSLSSTQAVTIGAGGSGGVAASATDATAGGTTSWGTACTAAGGTAGSASNTTVSDGRGGAGGPGGATGTGDFVIAGSPGSWGLRLGSSTQALSGSGGGSAYGGGGVAVSEGNSASANTAYGGGGAGGASNSTTGRNGGAGGPGFVIVEEYE